jgi:transcriptional regulator with XRE-family HTH domain
MAFTNAQCRAARALLNWTQDDLAAHSKITQKTIADFERGATHPHAQTLVQIAAAFEAAGIEFLNSDQPGVRFTRKSRRTRSTTPRGRS